MTKEVVKCRELIIRDLGLHYIQWCKTVNDQIIMKAQINKTMPTILQEGISKVKYIKRVELHKKVLWIKQGRYIMTKGIMNKYVNLGAPVTNMISSKNFNI